jgi:hypothetical protein
VPIVTGVSGEKDAATQVQYVDVGLNLDATIEGNTLRVKLEESALSVEKAAAAVSDPVLDQTVFEGSAALTLGKPITLGSLAIPGSTHREEIEATVEVIP